MAERIDAWKGGRLRLYMPVGPAPGPNGKLIERLEVKDGDRVAEHDYRPLGGGWAIRSDLPLTVPLGESDPKLSGIRGLLDWRHDRFQCVGLISVDDGPALTSSVLRGAAAVVARLARDYWPTVVVRIVEHDGELVAEMPVPRPGEALVVRPDSVSDDAIEEYERRHPRHRPGRPRDEERLAEVARLIREAKRIGKSPARHIAETIPGFAPATYRSWIRRAKPFRETKGEDDG